MTNAVPPLTPAEAEGELKPAAKKRAWIWVLLWLAGFLALPGFLVGLLHQQRSRQAAESLGQVSDAKTPVAPLWVPLRPDFRIEQAQTGVNSGHVTLLASEDVERTLPFYEHRFRETGFEVSTNLMHRDDAIATAILNASHLANGQYALVTLTRAQTGTRIEIAFSERK